MERVQSRVPWSRVEKVGRCESIVNCSAAWSSSLAMMARTHDGTREMLSSPSSSVKKSVLFEMSCRRASA